MGIDAQTEADMDVVGTKKLQNHPIAFKALTGMSVAEFRSLVSAILPAWNAAEAARLNRPGRRRARGAGRKFKLCVADQVLLTIIKTRFSAGGWAVGRMFGVNKDCVTRTAKRVLPLLHASCVDVRPLSLAERREHFMRAIRRLPNHGGIVQWLEMACGLYVDHHGHVHPTRRVTDTSAIPEYDLNVPWKDA